MTLPTPYYSKDGIAIYHGDCRDILPHLEPVDLVLTDPPYGVELGDRPRANKMQKHGGDGYESFFDDPEYVSDVVVPIVRQCCDSAKRVVLTPGLKNLFRYDDPDALWAFHWPNGAGVGRWKSFTCWQPVLCYGPAPDAPGCFPDTFTTTEQADRNGHPCPKPLQLWKRLLARVSRDGDTILDPFMGSGTTLVAARDLGRKCIGIEIEEEYCEIAVDRLEGKSLDTLRREQPGQAILPFGDI